MGCVGGRVRAVRQVRGLCVAPASGPRASVAAVLLITLCQASGGAQTAEVRMVPCDSVTSIEVDLSQPALRTAAESLQAFVRDRGAATPSLLLPSAGSPAPGAAVVGTVGESPSLAAWAQATKLSIAETSSTVDAFEVLLIDGHLVVNGANPRAALYGVYELQDTVALHGGIPADLHLQGEPALGLRLLHPRVRGGFGGYRKTDFEHIVRCGGNVAHLSHDWMGEKTLFSFVPCPEFPDAIDPATLEANREHLSRYLEWCDDYGLGAAMWLCEVVCQGGPWVPEEQREAFLRRFPAECLSDTGTYQGKTLCLAHPLVQQAYRGMVRRFLTDFPQISMVLVFTLDSSGELCDPESCPRHQNVSKLTQYNALLSLLLEEGRRVRPDFQAFSIGWGWHFRGDPEYVTQQAALPAGAGLTAPPDGEAWSFDRKLTDALVDYRRVTREHGQSFLGYDILLWGDDTVFPQTELYDFPLGVAAKLRRWQELSADGVFDQWGTQAEYVQCNAIALRQFLLHPATTAAPEAETFAQQLATRQFGEAAGPHVMSAWVKIEAAQRLQSDHAYYWHHIRPGWAGPTLSTPLTLEALQAVTLSGGEPHKRHGATDYAPYEDDVSRARALAPALSQAAELFSGAVEDLRQALEAVPAESRSAYEHWYTPEAGAPPRLSPRELVEKELVAVELQAKTQRRLGRFFAAFAIAKTLPGEGQPGREEGLAELQRLREEDEGG